MAFRGFIERHGLWSDETKRKAHDVQKRVEADGLKLIRIAWVDPHGAVRAKAVTTSAFKDALINGYNVNIATSTLDASGGRVFTSFVKGGGLDDGEHRDRHGHITALRGVNPALVPARDCALAPIEIKQAH